MKLQPTASHAGCSGDCVLLEILLSIIMWKRRDYDRRASGCMSQILSVRRSRQQVTLPSDVVLTSRRSNRCLPRNMTCLNSYQVLFTSVVFQYMIDRAHNNSRSTLIVIPADVHFRFRLPLWTLQEKKSLFWLIDNVLTDLCKTSRSFGTVLLR